MHICTSANWHQSLQTVRNKQLDAIQYILVHICTTIYIFTRSGVTKHLVHIGKEGSLLWFGASKVIGINEVSNEYS